jgi:hypothetical protein
MELEMMKRIGSGEVGIQIHAQHVWVVEQGCRGSL